MRYLNTILIILFLFFIDSSVVISKVRKIGDKYVPKNPRYDIYIVEVNNLKLPDKTMILATARLNVIEKIRGNIDIINIFDRSKKNYFNGSWGQYISQNHKSGLAKLEGEKIIVYGVKLKNVEDSRFHIYDYFPYSQENREIVLNNTISRIPQILTPLIFGFLFILLILKIMFYFDPEVKKGHIREKFVKVIPYLLPLELLLYGYYHYETSKHYDIRIDLLFLLPAFFVTIIFSALILSKNSNKETLSK